MREDERGGDLKRRGRYKATRRVMSETKRRRKIFR